MHLFVTRFPFSNSSPAFSRLWKSLYCLERDVSKPRESPGQLTADVWRRHFNLTYSATPHFLIVHRPVRQLHRLGKKQARHSRVQPPEDTMLENICRHFFPLTSCNHGSLATAANAVVFKDSLFHRNNRRRYTNPVFVFQFFTLLNFNPFVDVFPTSDGR